MHELMKEKIIITLFGQKEYFCRGENFKRKNNVFMKLLEYSCEEPIVIL